MPVLAAYLPATVVRVTSLYHTARATRQTDRPKLTTHMPCTPQNMSAQRDVAPVASFLLTTYYNVTYIL